MLVEDEPLVAMIAADLSRAMGEDAIDVGRAAGMRIPIAPGSIFAVLEMGRRPAVGC